MVKRKCLYHRKTHASCKLLAADMPLVLWAIHSGTQLATTDKTWLKHVSCGKVNWTLQISITYWLIEVTLWWPDYLYHCWARLVVMVNKAKWYGMKVYTSPSISGTSVVIHTRIFRSLFVIQCPIPGPKGTFKKTLLLSLSLSLSQLIITINMFIVMVLVIMIIMTMIIIIADVVIVCMVMIMIIIIVMITHLDIYKLRHLHLTRFRILCGRLFSNQSCFIFYLIWICYPPAMGSYDWLAHNIHDYFTFTSL